MVSYGRVQELTAIIPAMTTGMIHFIIYRGMDDEDERDRSMLE
jgi:hypothetical protein